MKVGVIGGGTVGRATARVWLEHCEEVRVYDTLKERATHSRPEVLDCNLVFVCLPEGEVERFFRPGVGVCGPSPVNFVLRSTVPVGTTRKIAAEWGVPNLVHNPEFLTERCALVDALTPARHVLGTPGHATPLNPCGVLYGRALVRRFPGVMTHYVTSDESEAVKLAGNAFFAVKVAFFNELRAYCDALKLDWDAVRAGLLSDGRIAHSHTRVPGPDGRRGFGGKCLPKDLRALIDGMVNAGVPSRVLLAAELYAREDSPNVKS